MAIKLSRHLRFNTSPQEALADWREFARWLVSVGDSKALPPEVAKAAAEYSNTLRANRDALKALNEALEAAFE